MKCYYFELGGVAGRREREKDADCKAEMTGCARSLGPREKEEPMINFDQVSRNREC